MSVKSLLLIAIYLATSISIDATGGAHLFRVELRDKLASIHNIDIPSDFLSDRALARRIKWSIAIDSTDLPIAQPYIDQLESVGARVVVRNKWLNSVVVALSDSSAITKVEALPIVTSCYCVYYPTLSKTATVSKFDQRISSANQLSSSTEREMLQADLLHNQGYKGAGLQIAVIDAGFWNVDIHVGIDQSHILESKDFTYPPSSNVYREFHHGTHVLSTMLSNREGYIGTAPDAHYYLFRSENKDYEWPVEQDFWIAAAEYADSIGVDLINSSLGYGLYDNPYYNIDKHELDGQTTWISRGASIATSKGILVVNSAGNEGDTPWRYILSPADVPTLLTVGAVKSNMQVSPFSSRGYQELKPDVMAQGAPTQILDDRGEIIYSNGTSFSAPLICGMMASLWQALPHLSAQELIDRVRKGSNRATHPDLDYGYGVPKFYDIYRKEMDSALRPTDADHSPYSYYSGNGAIYIDGLQPGDHIELLSSAAIVIQSIHYRGDHSTTLPISISGQGSYLIRISGRKGLHTLKVLL